MLDIKIEQGETVAVMGMSGAGKSTLLKCIAGLLSPSAGRLLLDGIDIAGMREAELNSIRRRIGMVFQYAALFDSLNVYENVSFGLRRHHSLPETKVREVVQEKLSMVGLPGTQSLMPSELSGGMQKRVGLARALAMEPDILLYDEPTAGLDPITSATIADLIIKTRDEVGATSIVVSHDLPTIKRISSKIAMLHRGRIIAMGTVEEMADSDNPAVRQFMAGSTQGPIQITR
ncbi:MAG: ABC transporter ATP-binding protein [Armatimonadetes bacterium]|nr:ABC transporter ATP-binding protein [Armatimonadota bacterium]